MKILISRSRNSKSDEKLTFSKVMELLDNSKSNKKKLWDIITTSNDEFCLGMIATYATDEDILEYLATNYDSPIIKRNVAANLTTSSNILNYLSSNNEDVTTRACVARNPNTSADTLKTLATDSSSYVRDAVIRNHNTPNEIIQFLADNDDDILVKLSVLKRLGSSEN